LRKKIYESMIKWIRNYDKKTPLYLCMEDKELWKIIDKRIKSSHQIEEYIIEGKIKE